MADELSPHKDANVIERGPAFSAAKGALILLHGRGGSAEDILSLVDQLDLDEVRFLAPQASEHTWYPNSFLAPIESNEPWLSSAMELLESVIGHCLRNGLSKRRIAIAGFSQGACLAAEFVVRHPQPYGALIAFTGGLIGPSGSDLHHAGTLDRTPVLLSSGDPDPHVPWSRVTESGRQFEAMNAKVHLYRYPSRPHTILPEEIRLAQSLLHRVFE
jgi:predicted esterase